MADDFQEFLQDPNRVPDEEIKREIDDRNEKEFLKDIKKKNSNFLINGLTVLEKERIAQYIINRYHEALPKHKEICDKMDKWDETFRMERREVVGSEGEMPNYVTPLSTVSLEVLHSNIMNVFFTPVDPMRALPVEEGDVPKIEKIDRFGNWSMKNEMDLFERCDELFHASGKNGEAPYIIDWHKEYGVEIRREIIMNPANPIEPLYDEDTNEPLFQEVEEPKLLYNGPRLKVFSRKDYIQPPNAVMGETPEYDMIITRMTYDKYLRAQLEGRMYGNSAKEIDSWNMGGADQEMEKEDYEGDSIPLGEFEQEFIQFYGRMRINVVKKELEDDTVEMEELEDEFIALVHIDTQTLCQLRKNKFPLKERPVDVDYFVPDDEGRRAGLGVFELMESLQTSYDAMYNQFILGTTQSNNPVIFFSPVGNTRNEQIKIKHGYMYPSTDPAGVRMFEFPQPDDSLQLMMELVRNWAQLMFGISDFSAGVESKIDPDAPAKKAEIV